MAIGLQEFVMESTESFKNILISVELTIKLEKTQNTSFRIEICIR